MKIMSEKHFNPTDTKMGQVILKSFGLYHALVVMNEMCLGETVTA